MSLRQLNKDIKRQLNNLQGVGSITSIAARIELLFPDTSEHYAVFVTDKEIVFKTKDGMVVVATYPATLTGLLMFTYEFDLNVATALMYYAEGGF